MELPYGVFILKYRSEKHYTGFTANIKNRLIAHSKGEVSFKKDKLLVKLIHISFF